MKGVRPIQTAWSGFADVLNPTRGVGPESSLSMDMQNPGLSVQRCKSIGWRATELFSLDDCTVHCHFQTPQPSVNASQRYRARGTPSTPSSCNLFATSLVTYSHLMQHSCTRKNRVLNRTIAGQTPLNDVSSLTWEGLLNALWRRTARSGMKIGI